MKRIATALILSATLAAGPAMAGQRGDVSGAIGATIGALIGSQVGHGQARLATTAAGAVGGYIIGKSVAYNGRGDYRDHDRRNERRFYEHYQPRLEPLHETFRAMTDTNVRVGPGTDYYVTGTLYRHEPVQVVAKVEGRDWLMIDSHGRRGFVYAPLLRPAHGWDRNQWRHDDRDRDHARWGH